MYGVSTINGYPMPMEERFIHYRNAGLTSVLLWWGNDEDISREKRIQLAEKHDLKIENVHAATNGLNLLWSDKEGGEKIFNELSNEIDDCSKYGVETIVLHLSNGSNPPAISELGISRIEKIIDLAERKKVQLAFENVRVSEHLKYVLDNFDSKYVGMCYDSGHEHYWTPGIDWLDLYGDRIFAVHLHDNQGDKDAHMLPFDGTIDWERKMKQIALSSYKGTITIEAEQNASDLYLQQDLSSFLNNIYQVGVKLEKIMKSKSSWRLGEEK